MKLTPTHFYAAHHDGLVRLDGHEFTHLGYTFVVHKPRPPYDYFDKKYHVSEKSVGFAIPAIDSANRMTAAKNAIVALDKYGIEKIDEVIKKAAEMRKTLKIIEG